MVNEFFKTRHPLYEYLEIVSIIEKKQKRSKKHKENISKIVKFLALNGPSSTWEISDQVFSSYQLMTADNMIRRIIKGRPDIHENKDGIKIKKDSPGLESIQIIKNISLDNNAKYSLTSYGMLYAIKSNNFSSRDFSKIAVNNKELFPLIFNKINYLRKYKITLNPLQKIANGDLMESQLIDAPSIFNEILTFLLDNYQGPLNIDRFSRFIQLWFFTFFIWRFFQTDGDLKKWLQIVNNDEDIFYEYYCNFFQPAITFFSERCRFLNKLFYDL